MGAPLITGQAGTADDARRYVRMNRWRRDRLIKNVQDAVQEQNYRPIVPNNAHSNDR
jgi:hypothetical protein